MDPAGTKRRQEFLGVVPSPRDRFHTSTIRLRRSIVGWA
jgi:hypothetical protein